MEAGTSEEKRASEGREAVRMLFFISLLPHSVAEVSFSFVNTSLNVIE